MREERLLERANLSADAPVPASVQRFHGQRREQYRTGTDPPPQVADPREPGDHPAAVPAGIVEPMAAPASPTLIDAVQAIRSASAPANDDPHRQSAVRREAKGLAIEFYFSGFVDGQLAFLVHAMLASGARKSEVLALDWSDVDLDRGSISIHRSVWEAGGEYGLKDEPKNASSRRGIALPSDCIARSGSARHGSGSARLNRAGNGTRTICYSRPGTGACGGRAAPRQSSRVSRTSTGCAPDYTIGDMPMRSCCSSSRCRSWWSRIGHSDPTMTMRVYQHVTEQAAQLAIAALDRGLANTSPASTGETHVTSDASEFADSQPKSGAD